MKNNNNQKKKKSIETPTKLLVGAKNVSVRYFILLYFFPMK